MTNPPSRFLSFLKILLKPAKWLLNTVLVLCLAWGASALYFSELPYEWVRIILAIIFFIFGIWSLWIAKNKRMLIPLAVMFIAISAYWSAIQPSNDRIWRVDMAKMPRAEINGDNIRITNFRNFNYRSTTNFDVHYETREVQLSHLTSVDFYISYWMPEPVAHTLVSFNFDNAPTSRYFYRSQV